MKKITLLLLALLSADVVAKDLLAVLSPKTASKAEIALLIEQLPKLDAGDNITVLNGADGSTIARLTLPEDERFHASKALFNFNQKPIAALIQFVQSLANKAPLNLPRVLGEIARYHRGYEDILIVGEVAFNMEEGHYPADSNLHLMPSQAGYGTRGIEERLKGFRMHWLLPVSYTHLTLPTRSLV